MKEIWNTQSTNYYKAEYPSWFDAPHEQSLEIDLENFFSSEEQLNNTDEGRASHESQSLKVKKVRLSTGRKTRNIFIPDTLTKRFYRQLLPELYRIHDKIALKSVAHGFLPGLSCVSQAISHIGYEYTLSLDIKDFFDSVRKEHLEKYIDTEKLDYLLIDGAPRQGLPTSPILANIALVDVDKKLNQSLSLLNFDNKSDTNQCIAGQILTLADLGLLPNSVQGKSFVYTRYADDISISVNDPKVISNVINIVRDVFSNSGFNLNEAKTKVLSAKNGLRIICGVGVSSNDIHITRKTKKKIRAARHQKHYSSLLGLYAWMNSIRKKKRR